MNVLEFNRKWKTNVVFCMVDNTKTYSPDIRPLIKNQADGVLSNLYTKGYNVLQWDDEDTLLRAASTTESKFAVVFSTGTEFLNGTKFFDNLEKLISRDFFIAGHILDRKDAYYELHSQCYIINLEIYKKLGMPEIGQQQLGSCHEQRTPLRSRENLHDDYTPVWVSSGHNLKQYNHKCHGWNILSRAFNFDVAVQVFDESIRTNKIHFYPESPVDFYKQLSWAYHRMNYCKDTFVHTSPTENVDVPKEMFEQIVTPASSFWFKDCINNGKVIYYDYNTKSLDYWKANVTEIQGVEFDFVECDLLGNSDFLEKLDPNKKTFINLSNIFNYEGTTFFYSLEYRKFKESQLIDKIKKTIKDVVIYSTMTAQPYSGTPTWHISQS